MSAEQQCIYLGITCGEVLYTQLPARGPYSRRVSGFCRFWFMVNVDVTLNTFQTLTCMHSVAAKFQTSEKLAYLPELPAR